MSETTSTSPETFERLTVNITARSSRALEIGAELTGDSKTDTLNRALQFYAFAMQAHAQGLALFTGKPDGTSLDRVELS